MIAGRIAVAAALLAGASATQAPEFTQQYRQRLGGALDELNAISETFRAEAQAAGTDVAGAIRKLEANPDPLAQARARAMRETFARRDRLAEQSRRLAEAGPVGRIFALGEDFDPAIARGAWSMFQPAVPISSESLSIGGAGALLGYVSARLVALPFRRRRPQPT